MAKKEEIKITALYERLSRDDEQPPQRPSNGAKQKRAGGRRFGQRQDEILRQTKSHAMCVGKIPLLIRCDRPERLHYKRIEKRSVSQTKIS